MASPVPSDFYSFADSEADTIASYSEFICSVCRAEFGDPADLKQHMLQIHVNNANVHRYCIFCERILPSLDDFAQHLIYNHISDLRACKYCCRLFNNEIKLRFHENKHLVFKSVSQVSCSQCSLKFNLKQLCKLIAHDSVQHETYDDGLMVRKCFPHLATHLNTKVPQFLQSLNSPTNIRCLKCQYKSYDTRQFIRHQKTSNCQSPACDSCGEPFKNMLELTFHIKKLKCISKNLDIEKCDKCNNKYNSNEFDKHKNTCRLELKCKICNLIFKSVVDMSQHFSQKHISVASVIKCKYCLNTFVGEVLYKKHYDRIHKHEVHLYKYSCYLCEDVIFKHPKKLFCHFNTHHRDIEPYTCNICDKTFKRCTKFSLHIKIEHSSEGKLEYDDRYFVTFNKLPEPGSNEDKTPKNAEIATENSEKSGNKDTETIITEKTTKNLNDNIEKNKKITKPDTIRVQLINKDTGASEMTDIIIISADTENEESMNDTVFESITEVVTEYLIDDIEDNAIGDTERAELSNEITEIEKDIVNIADNLIISNTYPTKDNHDQIEQMNIENLSTKLNSNEIIESKNTKSNMKFIHKENRNPENSLKTLEIEITNNEYNTDESTEHIEYEVEYLDDAIEDYTNEVNYEQNEDYNKIAIELSDDESIKEKRVKRKSNKRNKDNKRIKYEKPITDSILEYASEYSSDDDTPLNLLRARATKRKKYSKIADSDASKFICKYCKKYCYTFQNYNRHMSFHLKHESKQCLKCGKLFQSYNDLKYHISKIHNKSKLTETLQSIIEKRKKSTLFNIKPIVTDSSVYTPSITIVKKVDDDVDSMKYYLENFTTDLELKEATVTVSLINKPMKINYKIKTQKLNLKKTDYFRKLSMPVPFSKCYNDADKPKVNIQLGNVNKSGPKLNFGYSTKSHCHYSTDDIPDDEENNKDNVLYELRIPEIAHEIMLASENQPKKILTQQQIVIPDLHTDLEEMHIAHLMPEAPYYKIIKVSSNPTEQEDVKPKLELPKGIKLINTNPLKHLLKGQEIKPVRIPAKYRRKHGNYENAVTKAFVELAKEDATIKPIRNKAKASKVRPIPLIKVYPKPLESKSIKIGKIVGQKIL